MSNLSFLFHRITFLKSNIVGAYLLLKMKACLVPQDEYSFTGGLVRSLFNLSFSELFSGQIFINFFRVIFPILSLCVLLKETR